VAIASFGLLFNIHTQMLQHKAAFKKESAGKNKNKKNTTKYLKLVPT
jgi:hypothetical protein